MGPQISGHYLTFTRRLLFKLPYVSDEGSRPEEQQAIGPLHYIEDEGDLLVCVTEQHYVSIFFARLWSVTQARGTASSIKTELSVTM